MTGQGGNEWLKDPNPDAFNGSGYLSLPESELPQTVNPKNGFVVNANNDTSGRDARQRPAEPAARRRSGHLLPRLLVRLRHRAGRITQSLNERFARVRSIAATWRRSRRTWRCSTRRCSRLTCSPRSRCDAAGCAGRTRRARDRSAGRRSGRPAAGLELHDADRCHERLRRRRCGWREVAAHGIRGAAQCRRDDLFRVARAGDPQWRRHDTQRPGRADAWFGEAIKALRHLVERDGIGLSTVDFCAWRHRSGYRRRHNGATT